MGEVRRGIPIILLGIVVLVVLVAILTTCFVGVGRTPPETRTETVEVTHTITSKLTVPVTFTETLTTTETKTVEKTYTTTEVKTKTETKRETITLTIQASKSLEDEVKEWLGSMKFSLSFHATTKGMKYWYDVGFFNITGIPYESLGCKNCHATCESCHLSGEGFRLDYSVEKARDMQENCLTCHGRERFALKIISKVLGEDAHFSKGITCVDCHSTLEIHGLKFKEDGTPYKAYREPGFFEVDCTNCHVEGDAPKPLESIPEHSIHWYTLKNVHCTACHTKTVQTCYSCHFDGALKGVPHSKLHTPLTGWVFLLKYEGMVYPGNVMALTFEEKEGVFLAWAPFFSHIVVREGRHCNECHGIQVVKEALNNNRVTVVWWNETKEVIEHVEGIIPVVEGVDYTFTFFKKVDYDTGKVEPYKTSSYKPEVNITIVNFGEPLSREELKLLAQSMES